MCTNVVNKQLIALYMLFWIHGRCHLEAKKQWRKPLASLAHAFLNTLHLSNGIWRIQYITICLRHYHNYAWGLRQALLFSTMRQWRKRFNLHHWFCDSRWQCPYTKIACFGISMVQLILYQRPLWTITMHNQYIVHNISGGRHLRPIVPVSSDKHWSRELLHLPRPSMKGGPLLPPMCMSMCCWPIDPGWPECCGWSPNKLLLAAIGMSTSAVRESELFSDPSKYT